MFRTKLLEKIKTHILCFVNPPPTENRAVYQIMWGNVVERIAGLVLYNGHLRIACWISKATKPHSEYLLLIAFVRQEWLRERVSTLLYKHIGCLVIFHAVERLTKISALICMSCAWRK